MTEDDIVNLLSQALSPSVNISDSETCISLPFAPRGNGELHVCHIDGPDAGEMYRLWNDDVVPDGETRTRRIEEFIAAMGATIKGSLVETHSKHANLACAVVRFLVMLRQIDDLAEVTPQKRNADELTRFWMRKGLRMRAARILAAAGLRGDDETRAYGIERLLQDYRAGVKTAEELRRRFKTEH